MTQRETVAPGGKMTLESPGEIVIYRSHLNARLSRRVPNLARRAHNSRLEKLNIKSVKRSPSATIMNESSPQSEYLFLLRRRWL